MNKIMTLLMGLTGYIPVLANKQRQEIEMLGLLSLVKEREGRVWAILKVV